MWENMDSAIETTEMELLRTLRKPKTAAELARQQDKPLPAIQDSLRIMHTSGLVAVYKESYVLTEKGKTLT